ncbi:MULTISPECIES: nitrogenase molybdenum-iron protein subunit beta [Dehalococcoides]|jgi:nitrogenase molybdenum-iron protein beta chain|uniref:Nitrogenase molybdenum-iron protein beta chain n=2 Tax=root TaxID=1 RepID=A0A644TG91_9ZZZZ|nr:nitrogenase molybdenum-iron protein subunit beta [Dehalococcoides sp.]MEA4878971.1 nitrogenase molybdenum-iron protein subunit beta [Dehalococcoides mccartyi]
MLLRHTAPGDSPREALTINPAKTCQPIGAMYAALGIHNCLPHSHGSQGCCAYHRSTLTRHYKEQVLSGTSSFTEGASVFGGQANLLQAIDNIFSVYNPDIIAVHTTCLSETIGDDITQIISKAKIENHIPQGKLVIHTNTPSYAGSHVTGFANMVKSMVQYLSEPAEGMPERRANIIPGWVEPADMREIKRLVGAMGINYIMFPDTSGVLDTPLTGHSELFPAGGTTIKQLRDTGRSKITFALGEAASGPAALQLDSKCKVPYDLLDLPIGLQATDRFINALCKRFHVDVPESITEERGRLLNLISNLHQYTYGKRVALWGDPDQLVALSEFLVLLNMKPVYVLTGTPGKRFEERMAAVLGDSVPEAKIAQGPGADMYRLHQWIKQEGVDLLIGNTYGKYIARDENTPLVRLGFPILDRVGHQYFPVVGYRGAMRLLEMILNAFLDKKDRECKEESFELVM